MNLDEAEESLTKAANSIKNVNEKHPLYGHIVMYLSLVNKDKKQIDTALENALKAEDIMKL